MPLAELKSSLTNGRKSIDFGVDTWAPKEAASFTKHKSFQRLQRRPKGAGPSFGFSSTETGDLGRRIRNKYSGPKRQHQGLYFLLDSLATSSVRSPQVSVVPPSSLDRAAAHLKQIADGRHASDEDFVSAARLLRAALKEELHSDPPMADACLVLADALMFTSADQVQRDGLGVLNEGLVALTRPRGQAQDARKLFSLLIKAGWKVTPEYDVDDLNRWLESLDR